MPSRDITKGRRFTLGLGLLLAALAVSPCALAGEDKPVPRASRKSVEPAEENPSPKPSGHTVARVVQREVMISPTASGVLEASETVELRGRVNGYLAQLSFREGQELKKGDLVCEIDDRPYKARLDQAMAQLAKDQAALANARRLLDRNKSLLASNVISREEVEVQMGVVQQAEASCLIAQALIEQAKLDLQYTRVIAPISGRIGFALVTQGNVVRADETLIATLTSPQMAVTFSLSDVEFLRLMRQKRGDALAVEVSIAGEKLATGRLEAINNQVDPVTGLIRMKASLENADQTLIAGMHVQVRILSESKRTALVIPASAVQSGPEPYVYVVRSDEKLEARTVALVAGVIAEDPSKPGAAEVAVESGLRVGETIVVEQFAPASER